VLTAIKLAGYSWMEADKLRKAMGKKIPEVMAAERQKLIDGLVKNGLTPQKAEVLWKLIEPFAGYGFGKAHAASYGRVAYQTAYMKANYPAIYMSAVLTAESGDIETVAIMIHECERMGIPVLPPDVNESFSGFTVIKGAEGKPDSIRFGLYTIKNVGAGVADAIIAERKRGGPYQSVSDFLTRVQGKAMNRKSLESLIKCGAFDTLGERGQLITHIEELLRFSKAQAAGNDSQDSLFSMLGSSTPTLNLPSCTPASMEERLAWEKELLGLYLSGHPLDKFKEQLSKVDIKIGEIKSSVPPGIQAVAYGFLEDVRSIYTKRGDKMLFLKIADTTGSIEAVVFPKTLEQYPGLFEADKCVAVKGRLTERNGEKSIVVEKAKSL
jgi:DNA polymerase III subunit alpha